MRVTYIDHSSFYLETEQAAFLFDWFRGEIPPAPADRPLYVLVSHAHGDHYSPELFDRLAGRPGTEFILSSDVSAPRVRASITHLGPHETAEFPGLHIETLDSTDAGVAFVLECAGKRILHMGDLNWWDWGAEDTPEEAEQMERVYRSEISRLRGTLVDLAFVPLDPRLGGAFWKGLDTLMRAADVRHVIPMHCWGDYTMTARLRKLGRAAAYADRVLELTGPGQIFELED